MEVWYKMKQRFIFLNNILLINRILKNRQQQSQIKRKLYIYSRSQIGMPKQTEPTQ